METSSPLAPDSTTTVKRPVTPHDFNLLKFVTDAPALPTSAPSIVQTLQLQETPNHVSPPETPTLAATSDLNRGSVNSYASETSRTTKHDSVFQPSHSSPRSISNTSRHKSSTQLFHRSSSAKTALQIRQTTDGKSLESRRLRKKSIIAEIRRQESAASLTTDEPQLPSHWRVKSFHGISMDIPNSELEDLHDADKLQFSNRGSMLIGTKKADAIGNMVNGGRLHDLAEIESVVTGSQVHDLADVQEDAPPMLPTSPRGLQPGRRTPSVHLLQSRGLSTEERSFSIRLRSMYDNGDENAADWTHPSNIPYEDVAEREHIQSHGVTNPGDAGSLKVAKRGTLQGADRNVYPSTSSVRTTLIARTTTEVAGGLEDYGDVSHADVDRYGFIMPTLSHTSDHSSLQPRPATAPPERPAMHRVSTPIQLFADSPKQQRALRRKSSTATKRMSRSSPPQTRDGRSIRTQSSRHSMRSTGAFSSRDRRLVDSASDMLTRPSRLESISEHKSAGGRDIRKRQWTREEKWRRMATFRVSRPSSSASQGRGGGMSFTFDTTSPLLIARTWKGIPDSWRATAWHSFLLTSAQKRHGAAYETDAKLITQYHELQDVDCADDVQIDVDVPRTISLHVMFRKRYRGGQRLLFRVLHAIALRFPDTGYVQGMASLASTLLCYFDEEMSYVMLVRMWELRGLQSLYSHGFKGLLGALKQFEGEWLGKGRVDVGMQLENLGIDGTAYGTRWYLTLFGMSVPFSAMLRIWDVFMLLGDAKSSPMMERKVTDVQGGASQSTSDFDGADLDVLHAASAALIDATREILLDADFENAMKVLTSWIPIKDEDLLMRVAKAEWKAKKKRDRSGKN